MDEFAFAIVIAVVIAYSFAARRLSTTPLTGPLLLTAAGLALGPDGLGWVELGIGSEASRLLIETTLALVLFTGASRVSLRRLAADFPLPSRLLGIGLPLTILAGWLLAAALLDLPIWEALLVGVILAPTDAALGEAVITNPSVPVEVRETLSVESGLNDGIAVPFFFVAADLALEVENPRLLPGTLLETIGIGLVVGLAVGFLLGAALDRADARGRLSANWRSVAVLLVPALAFGLADPLGGSGFIATFVAGMVFGARTEQRPPEMYDTAEDLGELLTLLAFFAFGALALGPTLDELDWRIALYVVLSLTAVRMLPVSISLLRTGLARPPRLLIGWFGPRGLASAMFTLLLLESAGSLGAFPTVTTVAVWTIAISILAHGLSAFPLSAAYGRWLSTHDDPRLSRGAGAQARADALPRPLGPARGRRAPDRH